MTTKTFSQIAASFVIGTLVAIIINASITDFTIGILGGLFIIFLWSKRP